MVQLLPKPLMDLILGGESICVECKESRREIPKSVYESVCAFSNRDGGNLFLGVSDTGEIVGIEEDCVEKIKKDFVTTVNNGHKVYPPLYLAPISYEMDGKQILYVRVPESREVCRCGGRIFDRNNDSDMDITYHSDAVYRLYARKNGSFSSTKSLGLVSMLSGMI